MGNDDMKHQCDAIQEHIALTPRTHCPNIGTTKNFLHVSDKEQIEKKT